MRIERYLREVEAEPADVAVRRHVAEVRVAARGRGRYRYEIKLGSGRLAAGDIDVVHAWRRWTACAPVDVGECVPKASWLDDGVLRYVDAADALALVALATCGPSLCAVYEVVPKIEVYRKGSWTVVKGRAEDVMYFLVGEI